MHLKITNSKITKEYTKIASYSPLYQSHYHQAMVIDRQMHYYLSNDEFIYHKSNILFRYLYPIHDTFFINTTINSRRNILFITITINIMNIRLNIAVIPSCGIVKNDVV
eukprot:21467_1